MELTVSHYEFSHFNLRPISTIQFWSPILTDQFEPLDSDRLIWTGELEHPIPGVRFNAQFEPLNLDIELPFNMGVRIAILGYFKTGAFPFYPSSTFARWCLSSWRCEKLCSLSRISIRSSLSTTQKMFIHYYF